MEKKQHSFMPLLGSVVRLLCLLALVYFVVRWIDANEAEELEVKDTPVVIESIKPIGQLYAYSAITEDFAIDNVEKVGFFSKKYYKAVQTLRMKVSYVLNLDSVEYVRKENSDTVVVKLPELRYTQSSQGGNFLCEVEMANYDAAKAISIVEQKVRSKYDSPENRKKAMTNVRNVLSAFVNQCGLTPVFVNK
jgi:hypothetical protein